jgi:hypothetical protein
MKLGDPTILNVNLNHEKARFKRCVAINDGFVVIADSEESRRTFCVKWTFAPDVAVTQIGLGSFKLERDGGSWIISLEGGFKIPPVSAIEVSPSFNRASQAKVISVKSSGNLRTVFQRA